MSEKQPDPIFEELQRHIGFEQEIRAEIDAIESQVRAKRRETFLEFRTGIAEAAGIDLDKMNEDGLRRSKVQRRLRADAYKRIRDKSRAYAMAESKRDRAAEKAYYEAHFADALKTEGNPCQLVWDPAEAFPPITVPRRDTPGGMVGYSCKPPDMADHEYEDDLVLDHDYSAINHLFYPRVYAATGDDDDHVFQSIEQTITMRRRALPRGRGNFEVDTTQIWFRGVGHYDICEGSPPLFGEGALGHTAEASVGLFVMVIQEYADAPDSYVFNTVFNAPGYWSQTWAGSGPLRISPYVGAVTAPFDLYSPENGGGDIFVSFSVTCFAGAYTDEARAEVDFNRRDFEGLNLCDVRLCGDWA